MAADSKPAAVRGKLAGNEGKPALETADRKLVYLEADEPITGVLRDKRLKGADFEARGRFVAPDRFRIDPVHTRPVSVYKDGKPLLVTYWCEVCSIRTWTPGKCWCCQEETALDLQDPETLPNTP
jgi:hypothetical protein